MIQAMNVSGVAGACECSEMVRKNLKIAKKNNVDYPESHPQTKPFQIILIIKLLLIFRVQPCRYCSLSINSP